MIMVAAVVFMLRMRASRATGEAMAPQASSLTVHTTRASIGTAMKPARSPRAPIASPETSHSRPPENAGNFRPVLLPLTRCSLLLGRGLKVPFLENLLSSLACHQIHPLPCKLRVFGILQSRYRIGRDDVQVGRYLYDLDLVPYVWGVVASVAEGGVGVSHHHPVDGGPYISLPGDHVGKNVILEVRSVFPVGLAQDLHGVVGRRHVLGSEHELYVRLGHVLEAAYVGGVVPRDHDDLAVFDEHLGCARDQSVIHSGIYLLLGGRGEHVGG